MGNRRPSLEIQRSWSGHEGELSCEDEVIDQVTAFSIRGPKYQYDESWTLELHLAQGEDQGVVTNLRACNPSNLVFEGSTDEGQEVTARGLILTSDYGPELSASSPKVEVGTSSLPEEPRNQELIAVLAPPALVGRKANIFVPHRSGEVLNLRREVEGEEVEDEVQPLSWRTEFGVGEVKREYRYESVLIGGERSLLRVPEVRLRLSIAGDSVTRNPQRFLNEVKPNVDWLARLLSFFSRQHVRCVELMLASTWGEGSPDERRTSRHIWSVLTSTRPDYLDPLILHPGRMDRDALSVVKRNIDSLPYSDAIFNSIGFAIEGFRARLIGAQLMNTFTAFETLVSAITEEDGTAFPLDRETFSELRNELQAQIKQFFPGGDTDRKRVREALYRNLGRLRRSPFPMRAASLIRRRSVQWKDLWPQGTKLEDAVSAAYTRRSELLHTGNLPNSNYWYRDLFRIHALTERIIYSEIGADPNWMTDGMAYSHCRDIAERSV